MKIYDEFGNPLSPLETRIIQRQAELSEQGRNSFHRPSHPVAASAWDAAHPINPNFLKDDGGREGDISSNQKIVVNNYNFNGDNQKITIKNKQ